MNYLPFDYARCWGTTLPICQVCRRREPGREYWQPYTAPVVDLIAGTCPEFIEPPPIVITNNTSGRQK
jgi:hypothetical protein